MRGGQTALNSEDLEEQRKLFLRKLLKNRPFCEMSLGNKMVLNRFLDHFLNTFLTKFVTFLMLCGNLTQVATSRPCRARCI